MWQPKRTYPVPRVSRELRPSRVRADRFPTPIRHRRPRQPFGGRGISDAPAGRALLAVVATCGLFLLVYLVSLSSRPAITHLSPAPGSTTPPGSVRISATVRSNPRAIQRAIMTIDGAVVSPAVNVESDHVWILNFEGTLLRGPHQVRVAVVDTDGKVKEHTWSFQASGPRLAPTLSIVSPLHDASFPAGLLRLEFEATSNTTVVFAEIRLNGNPIPTSLSLRADENRGTAVTDTGVKTWTIVAEPTLQPGDYQLELRVGDTFGETSTETVHFSVVADSAQASAEYFPDTQQFVANPFKSFWHEHEGPLLFGNPISPQFTDDRGITVQYFERARFELAPDGGVNLGLLGLESMVRASEPVENPNNPAIRFFPETNHTLAGQFRQFWEQHGGIAIFGYPITEEVEEGGTRVQYFERARLELHPTGDGTSLEVEITPLGRQIWQSRNTR